MLSIRKEGENTVLLLESLQNQAATKKALASKPEDKFVEVEVRSTEGCSDLESCKDLNSSDVATSKSKVIAPESTKSKSGLEFNLVSEDNFESESEFESDPETDSHTDSDTESERGMLHYLKKMDGHRQWKGIDGTFNDLRDCLVKPGM
jgi:hypothetical protein